jgi:hypothetical protein
MIDVSFLGLKIVLPHLLTIEQLKHGVENRLCS